MRSHIPRVYSRACGCDLIGAFTMHVSAVLPAHFSMEDLYLSEPTGPPSLLRVRRPDFKTFLLAHDTSLVVGVLGTCRANSGKFFLSYSMHLFRVMGIVATVPASTGMSFSRTPFPLTGWVLEEQLFQRDVCQVSIIIHSTWLR